MSRAIWLIHQYLFNPWRCHYDGRRGCSPVDYPDGSTEWRGNICGCHYWEHDGQFERFDNQCSNQQSKT
jgi:hypothetical protein